MLESSPQFSSWSSDTFVKDPAVDHTYSFDSSVDEFSETYGRGEKLTACSQSPVQSGSGSSSGGGDSTNLDEDIQFFLPVSDAMLLDDFIDSMDFGDLSWEELEACTDQTVSNYSTTESSVSPVPRKHGKRKKKSKRLSSMQWSKMSCEQQFETVEALTQIISQKMTLREQIEIITVIDPSAVITPNDTEFAIDLGSLNDSKLQIIRDIVHKHAIISSSSSTTSGLPPKSAVTHKCRSNSHHASKVKSSKKQAYEKRPYLEEIELRKRKLLKQKKKERRSGLFLREKKIKRLRSNPQDEDVDVNILE